MRKLLVIAFLVVIASFLVGVFYYNSLPDQIISHWNFSGNADGFSHKNIGLFSIPIISLVIFFVLLGVFYLDPLRNNIRKFITYYDATILVISLFFLYIQGLVIFANIYRDFNFITFIVPAFSALFFFIGFAIQRAKRNWIFGVRTPWTLSSDEIWDRTHVVAGKMFEVAAIISLGGIIFRGYELLFILIPLFISAFLSVIYSYIVYSQHKKEMVKNSKKGRN